MLSFSIITCTWNSEPHIAQCIASVASQTHRSIEHIFVDGGSTDGTLERIKSVASNNNWVTDVRGGISSAMNRGAQMARGDVIAHLHGDDYYICDDAIESVAAEMARSNAGWLFARIVNDVDGMQVAPNWRMPNYSPARLLRGNFVAHPAVFVRRSVFLDAGGFDATLRFAMDYDLWLRLSRMSAPTYLPRALAAFRCHEGSTSTANPQAAFEEDHIVRRRYLSGPLERAEHEAIYALRRLRSYGLRKESSRAT